MKFYPHYCAINFLLDKIHHMLTINLCHSRGIRELSKIYVMISLSQGIIKTVITQSGLTM